MRFTNTAVIAALVLFSTHSDAHAQRGRGGFGGRGSFGAGGGVSPAAFGAYGAAGVGAGTRTSGSFTGPLGGGGTFGSGSGSYTTQRGTTIDYAGAGGRGTTPGGVDYGRGVGGVQVTTPGGKEVTKVGTVGGASGPGGNAAVGGRSITTGSGPGGSFATASRGGVAVGPQGVAAAGGRVGTATGAAGTVSGASRWGAAAGPYGAAAYRGGVAIGPGGVAATGGVVATRGYGTYYRSAAVVSTQGAAVRYNCRTFAQTYPALTARWLGPTWRPVTWAVLSSYASYPADPVSYDYGDTVVYQGDTVYVNGESAGTPEQFAQQATDLVNTGKEAKADPKADEWQPLGVFAMVGEGETNATNIFQLALNKEGVIRGEYYNALTDETSQIAGSVDKKTQRAAWAVVDRKFPVYEAGIANLTKDETTMLVHFSNEKAKQFTLVRIPQPDEAVGR